MRSIVCRDADERDQWTRRVTGPTFSGQFSSVLVLWSGEQAFSRVYGPANSFPTGLYVYAVTSRVRPSVY